MNQIERGTKVPVHMILDADLVDEAANLTSDLSATVNSLLAAHVAPERAKHDAEQRGIDASISWHNSFVDAHGLPGEQFSPS